MKKITIERKDKRPYWMSPAAYEKWQRLDDAIAEFLEKADKATEENKAIREKLG